MTEKEEQLKQINNLMLKEDKGKSDIPTSEEVKRSDLYLELTSKLTAATRKLEEFETKSSSIEKQWSTAIANAEMSKKAMEDMQANFSKRWAELSEGKGESAQECRQGEGEGGQGTGRSEEGEARSGARGGKAEVCACLT